MINNTYFYSNEIAFAGHPDKVCDQISDALLTAYLKIDPDSHCGIEVMGTHNTIYVSGEVSSNAQNIPVKDIVYQVLKENLYNKNIQVINNLNTQSPDINQGVINGGAGDQGMMFGYASMDTPDMLPLAQLILQRFAISYDVLCHLNENFYPDGKAQITGEYDCSTNKLLRIKDFTVSYSNSEKDRENTDAMIKSIAETICENSQISIEQFHINPTGKFSIWGFEGDCGLTGRKIVSDSYHSFAPAGGGAFSGKDPTKVDRSGAYYARWLARRILHTYDFLHQITVQLSYTIGMENPMAICIMQDNGKYCKLEDLLFEDDIEKLYAYATPSEIIKLFDLKHFDYTLTSKYGHFGFPQFPWEK